MSLSSYPDRDGSTSSDINPGIWNTEYIKYIKKYLNYDSYLIFRPLDRIQKNFRFKEKKQFRNFLSKYFSSFKLLFMPILFNQQKLVFVLLVIIPNTYPID